MAAHDRALIAHARNGRSFADAAKSYLDHGGEGRYLTPIIDWFGDRLLTEIAPFDVRQMAEELYPEHSGATRNRQAITPARAVLGHAYDRGWCPLMRIRNFKVDKPRRKAPPAPVWMFAFLRQCEADQLHHLAALVLFMHQTGARVSEAVRLRWPDVHLARREAVLLKTKTSTNSVRSLTDELVERIGRLDRDPARPVFRYTSRHSVYERMKAVCERADISFKGPHLTGRHAFATNAMADGVDIATAMEAGDWKSVPVFIGTYVHARNAGRTVADCFNSMRFDATL